MMDFVLFGANVIAWICAVTYLVGFFWIVFEAMGHSHVVQHVPEKIKATLGEKISGVGIAATCVTFAICIWNAAQTPEDERKAFLIDPTAFQMDFADYLMNGAFILSAGVCGVGFIMVARDVRQARKQRQCFEMYVKGTG